jgi:hypothetical protein
MEYNFASLQSGNGRVRHGLPPLTLSYFLFLKTSYMAEGRATQFDSAPLKCQLVLIVIDCASPWPTGSFPHSHGCRSGPGAGILAVNGKAECSRCSSQSNDGSSEYSGDDPVRKRWPLPVLLCGLTVLKGQSGIGTYIFGLTWMIYIYWFLNNIKLSL